MPALPAAARLNEADLEAFTTTAPPPPYSESAADFPTTPQHVNRPRLPEAKRNHNLLNLPEDATLVKFQTIVREGQEIVVGRIKVPTVSRRSTQHAFILRRYDTQAISLTTMFKVSFPGATEEEEKKEMEWVRSSYDTRNTNGGRDCDAVRLAGQWVSRHLAIHLAPAYGISNLVTALSRAVPDPSVSYRKSQRSQAAADQLAKEKAASAAGTPAAPTAGTPTRAAPSLAAPAVETAARTPKRARRTTSEAAATPEASGSRVFTVEATTTVTAPAGTAVDMNAEIESAKQLVRDLKQQLRERAAAGEDLEDQGFAQPESSRGAKRTAGEADEGVAVAGGATGERAIRTNKRVEQGNAAVDTAKRVALGSILVGVGASVG
ncbi:hypothetical protein VHUM_03455 [Vanrija humicola]|uniref:HTH APSES-type domain-containing protein n=1 Tax=Vanrija humicola TaxID=5417 RepID=A0A7D8Z1P8_VANHU|nr:hypothetical protein VHUM_03455 [Vanrija humicola]